jgi:Universal stress protein UspA and related nucleotide-binding proteins
MRVLCCLDGSNAAHISKATAMLSTSQPLTLGLLYVIDIRPRKDIEHTRERFLRTPALPSSREKEMQQVDQTSAQDILNEGLAHLTAAEPLLRQGRPEREIVNAAAEWGADLVVICSRAEYDHRVPIGPKSVGHTARFVLDHAPCPVFLVRPTARDQFPIDR